MKYKTSTSYQRFVRRIMKASIYDGRGTYDFYVCPTCGEIKVTTYKDKGVTPFVIRCKCGDFMTHELTRNYFHGTYHEWYRPSFNEYAEMSPEMQEHIENGGLILSEAR